MTGRSPSKATGVNEQAAAVRGAAARVLMAVIHGGASASEQLPLALAKIPERDRALLQEMVYGSLRWRLRLEAVAARLLQKPLKDPQVHSLLIVGLYQLLYMRLPEYAAISSSVQAARSLGKPWAVGLLNGVLRNCQRRAPALSAQVDELEHNRLSHPEWLLDALKQDWPEQWPAIAEANNARPPMVLRVNLLRGNRAQYLARLAEQGIDARAAPHGQAAIVLGQPVDVQRLPGFDAGDVSVQDTAAQLTAEVLAVPPGARVLDACAAPGGKTALLLERYPGCRMVAVDIDAQRAAKIHDTLHRLQLRAQVEVGDAARPQPWHDGESFQCILLDAPCSATGVIRRHPDIKSLRRPSDIAALVGRQQELLEGVWPLLEPGGMLLYSTCSILAQENAAQVAAFLARQRDAQELPIDVDWGRPQTHGRQILPGDDDMDGFYFALLQKKAHAGR